MRVSAANKLRDTVPIKGTALLIALTSPIAVIAEEISLDSVSANGQVKEVIKSVLKNVKTAPGSTPDTVEFSVPGLVHGTVRMPPKESGQANDLHDKDGGVQSGATEASYATQSGNKDLATSGALPATGPALDIHFDGDGEAVGLPPGAVPNALDWLMPGKAKRAGRNLPSGFKGAESAVNSMPAIMP